MPNAASFSRIALAALACATLVPVAATAAPASARFEAPPVKLSPMLGSELGVRGTASLGFIGEVTLGVGSVRALLGDSRAPTFHLRLGYDFGALAGVPLAVFVQYGSFSGVPFGSAQMAVAAPTALGLTLRFSFDR